MSSSSKNITTLPSIFSDHMVLQQTSDIKIWGWDKPNEEIKVTPSWSNRAVRTRTDNHNKWHAILNTPSAGGPYTITVKGSNTIFLNDVLIGEVWLCSGQSNMEWSANMGIDNADQEINAARYPDVRLFKVNRNSADVPLSDLAGEWAECTPDTMKYFSSAGYFFGRHLFQNLNIPIGLIDSSWDGTPIETWINPEIVHEDQEFSNAVANFPELPWCPAEPGATYNAMIAPIIPFQIAGTIWYQGETNTLNPLEYRRLFPALIQNWRMEWGKDFPFYYVQIGPHKYEKPDVGVMIREAQLVSRSIPNTGMVVISDIVTIDDIHPKNKKDVGIRLANWALSETYGKENIVFSGPLYREMKIEEDKIRILFDYAENGLICDSESLTHFQIADTEREFVDADAEIDGNSVLVSTKDIGNPIAVRFAWSNTAIPNLFNKEGLPASCFRTDDWKL